MKTALRILFHLLIIRPVMWVIMGLNVRHRHRLPLHGPAVICANHNSHLDTLALLCLFPLASLAKVRPVAAADHFLKNPLVAWFTTTVINILPIVRRYEAGVDPLAACYEALDRGEILIIYPEGTRGEPERMSALKKGIAHLASNRPRVPITPIFLHGFGKSLPRGEAILVPFFCDVFIGAPLTWADDHDRFLADLGGRIQALAREGNFAQWQ